MSTGATTGVADPALASVPAQKAIKARTQIGRILSFIIQAYHTDFRAEIHAWPGPERFFFVTGCSSPKLKAIPTHLIGLKGTGSLYLAPNLRFARTIADMFPTIPEDEGGEGAIDFRSEKIQVSFPKLNIEELP